MAAELCGLSIYRTANYVECYLSSVAGSLMEDVNSGLGSIGLGWGEDHSYVGAEPHS